ncbi:DUF3841 domain-containing protein [Pseudomonas sp. DTU_2021_1001937_2_SI_NGA_ILE_001]|uniref:DUF3841 domain-containing protein n=1 Tax=Pseudomonas sp. DTU_2021_1001937_2_SI_NGA_ILE_001 TaxID=3077589 RepID=UPI0025EA5C44|nr:DUF3841 domain-containing protein [Pseudomonas sp. DTU_2021_1001937_2_SI_NGA_ILE_001]WNW10369.1 DUF3841 domain-containing protein [Pseudomonas sp. DTU_2021_1001937_2_SI_NGA_ILE_001]
MARPATDEHLAPDLAQTRKQWCDHFADDHGRVTAWMFIPHEILEPLMTGRLRHCSIEFADDDPMFRMAYQWMIDVMEASGIPSAKTGVSPWWCWVRAGYGETKPTARCGTDDQLLLELSIPRHELLLSDFDMWHVPLNYWINAEGEAEERFEREINAAGLCIYDDKPLPEPFHSAVQATWLDIFRLDVVNGFTVDFQQKSIQGVFWTLTPDMVKGVVEPAPDFEVDEHEAPVAF